MVILTASCDVIDKVVLLEMGADDYITKPFSPRELLIRMRMALRRSPVPARASEVAFDGIVVNFEKMEVTRNNVPVALSVGEFKILRFFIQNPDRVVTRAELLSRVWSKQEGGARRTIDNQIMKLRQKLENDPRRPTHLRTQHRVGYRFVF